MEKPKLLHMGTCTSTRTRYVTLKSPLLLQFPYFKLCDNDNKQSNYRLMNVLFRTYLLILTNLQSSKRQKKETLRFFAFMHLSKREIFHSYKKPRTFFTFFQSNRFNTIAVRSSYILPILKRFPWWKPRKTELGGGGLPPPRSNRNRNQCFFLSFGVDPLNWQSFVEIGEMTCSTIV